MCFPICKTKYQRKLTKEEEYLCVDIMLKKKLNIGIYIAVVCLEIILASCLIAFGIVYVVLQGPLYQIGQGIWVGSLILISEILALALVRYRNRAVFGLIELMRLVVGLTSIAVPVLSQVIMMGIWKNYNDARASLPPQAQSQVPYPWIIWVLWTLFALGVSTRPPQLCLTIYITILRRRTYKEFYLENYGEIEL